MRKPAKALIAVLLCGAVSVDADVVRTRGGGASSTAAAVTPGTTTATGCQNLVLYGDNSQVLNCEAAFGYATATNTLTADRATVATQMIVPAGAVGASSSILFANDTDTGIFSSGVGDIALSTNNGERHRFSNAGNFALTGSILMGTAVASPDLSITREAAAILQIGSDANPPTSQTLKAPDASGTDIVGGGFTLAAGRGTGAGLSGDFVQQTGTPLGTGTTAQTLVTRNHIEGGFRALVDATATTVFTVTTGNDVACSGTAEVTVEAQDAANVQATRAVISWAAVDATAGAGGEACSSGLIGTNVSAASSGTLTVTTDATTGTDLCNIRVTATGSLTETVGPRARYQVRMDPGSSTCAINPQ